MTMGGGEDMSGFVDATRLRQVFSLSNTHTHSLSHSLSRSLSRSLTHSLSRSLSDATRLRQVVRDFDLTIDIDNLCKAIDINGAPSRLAATGDLFPRISAGNFVWNPSQCRYASFQPWMAFLGSEADQIPFRGLFYSKSEEGVGIEGI